MAKRGRPKGSTNKAKPNNKIEAKKVANKAIAKAKLNTDREGNRIVNKGIMKSGNQNSMSVNDMKKIQEKRFEPMFSFGVRKTGR